MPKLVFLCVMWMRCVSNKWIVPFIIHLLYELNKKWQIAAVRSASIPFYSPPLTLYISIIRYVNNNAFICHIVLYAIFMNGLFMFKHRPMASSECEHLQEATVVKNYDYLTDNNYWRFDWISWFTVFANWNSVININYRSVLLIIACVVYEYTPLMTNPSF